MLTVVGLAVVVASVPVALLGAGWLLASALKIHQGWAMLLTAGAAIRLTSVAGTRESREGLLRRSHGTAGEQEENRLDQPRIG